MEYKFTYQIFPPHIFGLEDPGYTVLPAQGASSTYGPTLDTVTMNIVGRGSQTRSRLSDEQINEQITFRGVQCYIRDDFLAITIDTESADDHTAEQSATEIAADFCMVLSHITTPPCHYEFVQAVDESRQRVVPTTRQGTLGRFHFYDLDSLREWLKNIPAASS